MKAGEIHQLNVSGAGGVPKKPIELGRVTELGLEGDAQAKTAIHGGPYRALSLFPLEVIEQLASEGHPISPGSVGENVTTRGVDWALVKPGARLKLGAEVEVEITSYASPCNTVAGSFSDGNMNRINQRVAPDRSRIYAQVVRTGTLRPGDAIEIAALEATPAQSLSAGAEVGEIVQISLPVSDLERSIEFYRDRLGAEYLFTALPPGLAFFQLGGVQLMLDGPSHSPGSSSGDAILYLSVKDIDASYTAMRKCGVEFESPPILQYSMNGVDGWMAFLADPDGNKLALKCEVPTPAGRSPADPAPNG